MTMNTRIPAYYASVAQHSPDNAGNLLTGVAIAYAIIAIGLAVMLVSSKEPDEAVPAPATSHSTSIASDLAAIPVNLPIGVTDGTGYAGLEPPPAAPAAPFALSPATAKRAHDSRKPAGAPNRVAARAATFTGE